MRQRQPSTRHARHERARHRVPPKREPLGPGPEPRREGEEDAVLVADGEGDEGHAEGEGGVAGGPTGEGPAEEGPGGGRWRRGEGAASVAEVPEADHQVQLTQHHLDPPLLLPRLSHLVRSRPPPGPTLHFVRRLLPGPLRPEPHPVIPRPLPHPPPLDRLHPPIERNKPKPRVPKPRHVPRAEAVPRGRERQRNGDRGEGEAERARGGGGEAGVEEDGLEVEREEPGVGAERGEVGEEGVHEMRWMRARLMGGRGAWASSLGSAWCGPGRDVGQGGQGHCR